VSGTGPTRTLRRREVYPGAVVDGRPVRPAAPVRWRRRLNSLLVSNAERAEAELEGTLRGQPAPSRPNTVTVVSPKGGVGKTTSTFLLGDALASHLKLRVLAVDANPDFGTLAALAPDAARCERNLADLFADMDDVRTATGVRAYVSALPSGLHLLAAPRDPELMGRFGPDSYGQLLAFLSLYYDAVLLDLGTGLTAPLAQFALSRSDQVLLVTTPEWVTSSIVVDALKHLRQTEQDRFTVVANKFYGRRLRQLRALEEALRQQRLPRRVALPYDEQLAAMLDSGTYSLAALERPTRMAIKRLALLVAELFA
jgi:MinD-like ATPase involved in chromosome partitioning or flagellar assembly